MKLSKRKKKIIKEVHDWVIKALKEYDRYERMAKRNKKMVKV